MENSGKSKNEPGTTPAIVGPKKPAHEARTAAQGKRYGEALKRLVVEQIEGGKLTVAQAQRQHGIAGAQTIRAWQAKYGKAGGGVRRASALAAAQTEIGKLRREKAELVRKQAWQKQVEAEARGHHDVLGGASRKDIP